MHIQEVIDTFFLAAPALKTLKHISFFPYISNRKIVHTYYVASEIHLQIQFNSWHTTYTRNNMGQKCEHNCGLWVLNEIIKKIYPENLRKIVGAL